MGNCLTVAPVLARGSSLATTGWPAVAALAPAGGSWIPSRQLQSYGVVAVTRTRLIILRKSAPA